LFEAAQPRQARQPRQPRELPPPTIDVPAGTTLASQRPRLYAFAIDIFVMILILFGLQIGLTDRLIESWYPEQHARLDEIRNDPPGDAKSPLEEAKDAADSADEKADKAEDDNADNAAALRDDADEKKKAYDNLVDEDNDLSRDVYPAGLVVLEIAMVLCLLYLVIPSALTGQTLGKRLRGIRVVRLDGSRIGWPGAIVRYGTLILGANLLLILSPLFGILGLLLLGGLFFLVLGWMRNANRQGMQDRIAKTIVVDA
jgi:RDD family